MVEGLAKVLQDAGDIALCGASSNPTLSLQALSELFPDVVLLDQSSGLRNMFHFISEAHLRHPESRVVLWIHELDEVESFRALQVGARGILKKTLPPTVLTDCIRTVAGGGVWLDHSRPLEQNSTDVRRSGARLTPREKEIVGLVARGLKNRQIAETLTITPGTVKVHLMHIFEKTGVKDRFELAVEARRLLGPEPAPPALEAAPRSD
ncbi:MAG: response regulator transcription factor [Acidobacteria bacterium]|nr:response regulator transcription factor [Acidobacteriota bacterium]